ncbi:MAG TPA: aromatic ring-hydroxylating dioxygenase subunit alpha [Caldimonas sp.]|nr:aromatic ring-hydroxylating dioxygenase subunit alpha [Caldimonas sp.]HEX2542221.1 aromatic ring-hydroxylating dioxygenase subunit alpha [Caldimonas sp.]
MTTLDAPSLAALVEPDQVHRDVYTDPAVFALEMKRLWQRSWLFVGHASQVPEPGDFVTTSLAGQPVIMVRHGDASIRVLFNRCAHKGTRIASQPSGNTGRTFRCPYHAWTYRTDGSPLGRPLPGGYEGTRVSTCAAGEGLARAGAVETYRGFVFARLAPQGVGLRDSAGAMLEVLDNLVDRSPQGELRVAGGVLRSRFRANWKIYLENINDTLHPVSTHESAAAAATAVWSGMPDDTPKPMSIQQLMPFGSGYRFFENMGARVLPHGHSILGTRFSIHSGYGDLPGYEAALRARHGTDRTAAILAFSPQNAVFYPSLAVKASPLILRVLRPIAVDRTEVEAWALEPVGAPPELLQRALTYNRLVFSPMSVLAHDDLHVFEGIQEALAVQANPWVSLHRGHRADEASMPDREVGGTDEALMRNQFRAWANGMAPDGGEAANAAGMAGARA